MSRRVLGVWQTAINECFWNQSNNAWLSTLWEDGSRCCESKREESFFLKDPRGLSTWFMLDKSVSEGGLSTGKIWASGGEISLFSPSYSLCPGLIPKHTLCSPSLILIQILFALLVTLSQTPLLNSPPGFKKYLPSTCYWADSILLGYPPWGGNPSKQRPWV